MLKRIKRNIVLCDTIYSKKLKFCTQTGGANMFDYLFYYTNKRDDLNSDVSVECVQYVLSEGCADITSGHLNEHDVTCLLNSKGIKL